MMIIDFHNHFFPPAYLDRLSPDKNKTWVEKRGPNDLQLRTDNFKNILAEAHYNLDARLEAMDKHGVDMQCLTFTIPGIHPEPPTEGEQLAQIVNDGFAEAINQFPTRFTALAVLPLQDPAASVAELERAVTQLGLRGGTLFSHINGRQLDDPAFWPIYEKAIELDVPLWMHPTVPHHIGAMKDYEITVVAGFLHETTVAVSRLIYSGVLERYPSLTLVLSQMGGTIPFIAERIERGYQVYAQCRENLSTSPTSLLKRFYLDTTPFTPNAIKIAADFVGAEQILLGSDFPHTIGDLPGALATIRQLPVSEADKRKILGENAARLLKLSIG